MMVPGFWVSGLQEEGNEVFGKGSQGRLKRVAGTRNTPRDIASNVNPVAQGWTAVLDRIGLTGLGLLVHSRMRGTARDEEVP